MTRYAAIMIIAGLVVAGCVRTPERRASAGEWVGVPTDADGQPIAPPTFYAPKPAPMMEAP